MSADILRELALAKGAFQLRAIEAIMQVPAQAIETRSAKTAGLGPKDESAVTK